MVPWAVVWAGIAPPTLSQLTSSCIWFDGAGEFVLANKLASARSEAGFVGAK